MPATDVRNPAGSGSAPTDVQSVMAEGAQLEAQDVAGEPLTKPQHLKQNRNPATGKRIENQWRGFQVMSDQVSNQLHGNPTSDSIRIARKHEIVAKTIFWQTGPARGGGGTAGKDEKGRPLWFDGDRILVLTETKSGTELSVVMISCDGEDYFSITDYNGDEYCAWDPDDWSWWAKLDSKELPEMEGEK